jgi:hypothetical protein
MLGLFTPVATLVASMAAFYNDLSLLDPGHKWRTHGPVAGSGIGCNCSHFECQNIVNNWRSEAFNNKKWARMCESQECCGCENCIDHPTFPSKPATMTECYDCKDCSHCQYCDKCMYMPDTPDLLCSVLKVLPMTGMNNGSGNPKGDECETGGHKAIHNMNWGHRKGALGANFNALDVGMAFPRPVMLTGTWTNYDYEGYKVYISANGQDWDYVNTFKGNATFDPPINRVKDAQYRGVYFARVAWEYTDGPTNNWVTGIWFQFTGKKCPGHLCQEKGGPDPVPKSMNMLASDFEESRNEVKKAWAEDAEE